MYPGKIQAVVFFSRIVPALGELGATQQVEIFSAASIPPETDLESQGEVMRAVEEAASDKVPPATPWMLIAYSNN